MVLIFEEPQGLRQSDKPLEVSLIGKIYVRTLLMTIRLLDGHFKTLQSGKHTAEPFNLS